MVFNQALWFVGAFYFTWVPFLEYMWSAGTGYDIYGLTLAAATVIPLQVGIFQRYHLYAVQILERYQIQFPTANYSPEEASPGKVPWANEAVFSLGKVQPGHNSILSKAAPSEAPANITNDGKGSDSSHELTNADAVDEPNL
ncbi:hypothetical protein ACHAWO_013737 [Cyclotella atomus]|uniref:P-type ATPase C-terminal domain-containing protein n=1 Tax=Cyclotella atomus TaxID=382360 RepID=A0ABD3QU74_9STRA